MGFDKKSFMSAKLTARTEDVEVLPLQPFFGEGKAVWTVRNMAGNEVAIVSEAVEVHKNKAALFAALQSKNSEELAAAALEALGIEDNDETRADIVRRLKILELGSVKPECSEEMAVRLCSSFPEQFFLLTNKILLLTGQGKTVGKLKGSGKKKASEQV